MVPYGIRDCNQRSLTIRCTECAFRTIQIDENAALGWKNSAKAGKNNHFYC